MTFSEIRAEARKKLSGKWGKAVVITLIFTIIAMAISYIQEIKTQDYIHILLNLIAILITIPISFGYSFALFKIFKGEEVRIF